jgi:intracellular multiplication protein IcmS
MTDLSRSLELIVKDLDVKFTLKGTKIAYSEMCSATGLLPGLARRADQLSSLCLGYGLGIKIDDEDKSLLGYRVSFDEFTPNALRVFCIVDILFEIVKMSPTKGEVSLDELMYD